MTPYVTPLFANQRRYTTDDLSARMGVSARGSSGSRFGHLIFQNRLILAKNQLLKPAHRRVTVIDINQAQHHVCTDVLLIYRLRKNGNDIEPTRIDVAGLVKNRAVRMGNTIDIFNFTSLGRGD